MGLDWAISSNSNLPMVLTTGRLSAGLCRAAYISLQIMSPPNIFNLESLGLMLFFCIWLLFIGVALLTLVVFWAKNIGSITERPEEGW